MRQVGEAGHRRHFGEAHAALQVRGGELQAQRALVLAQGDAHLAVEEVHEPRLRQPHRPRQLAGRRVEVSPQQPHHLAHTLIGRPDRRGAVDCQLGQPGVELVGLRVGEAALAKRRERPQGHLEVPRRPRLRAEAGPREPAEMAVGGPDIDAGHRPRAAHDPVAHARAQHGRPCSQPRLRQVDLEVFVGQRKVEHHRVPLGRHLVDGAGVEETVANHMQAPVVHARSRQGGGLGRTHQLRVHHERASVRNRCRSFGASGRAACMN